MSWNSWGWSKDEQSSSALSLIRLRFRSHSLAHRSFSLSSFKLKSDLITSFDLLEGNPTLCLLQQSGRPFGEVSQSVKHNLFGRDGCGLAVTLYVPTSSSADCWCLWTTTSSLVGCNCLPEPTHSNCRLNTTITF